MDIQKAKRKTRLCAIAIVLSASAMINITRHGQVRNVEYLSIFAVGLATGAFIANLSLYMSLKKRKGQGVQP